MGVLNDNTRLGASAAGAYEIERSIRLDSDANAYLNRTPSSTTSRTTWTLSFWVKRSKLGSTMGLFGTSGSDNNTYTEIFFASGNNLAWGAYSKEYWRTTQLFRDTNAWYHIVVTCDTTNGTQADRQPVYVNGERITSFTTQNLTGDSTLFGVNRDVEHKLGERSGGSDEFEGYLAEVHFVDGTALDHTSFGETDEDTGQWIPKKYEGGYGTNGFFLEFKDNSGTGATQMGKDTSGNGNNWTPHNISVSGIHYVEEDSMLDTPTNNFPTLNPLIGTGARSGATPSNGNLDVVGTDESTNRATFIFGPGHITSGKWYFEVTNTGGANGQRVGLTGDLSGSQGSSGVFFRQNNVSWCAFNTYKKYTETTETSNGSYSTGDVLGIAYNADDDEVKYYRNGTLTLTDDTLPSVATTELHIVVHASNTGSNNWPVGSINFGQRVFDETPPTGYKKLCTANLSTPTIKNGTKYHSSRAYVGDGAASRTIAHGLSAAPDLWIGKTRSTAQDFIISDSVRGVANYMSWNGTGADAGYGSISWNGTAPNATNITVGENGGGWGTNQNSVNQVLYSWVESATAGFDIVGYNGDEDDTISHSLGVSPELIICKSRESSNDWLFWDSTSNNNANNKGLNINNSDATFTSGSNTFIKAVSNSTFTLGSSALVQDGSSNDYIAYLFSSVKGYSKIGTFVGNGNADGTFIYLGFKPSFFMWKVTNESGGWGLIDSARDPYNVAGKQLFPHDSGAEASWTILDFLSNGVKMRNTYGDTNGSNDTMVYLAFAERPFKYANAR